MKAVKMETEPAVTIVLTVNKAVLVTTARLRIGTNLEGLVWAAAGERQRSAANDRAGRELDRRSAKSEACSCVPSGTFIPG
jgi:hypothetical protein